MIDALTLQLAGAAHAGKDTNVRTLDLEQWPEKLAQGALLFRFCDCMGGSE
jgi:hypothetical protein